MNHEYEIKGDRLVCSICGFWVHNFERLPDSGGTKQKQKDWTCYQPCDQDENFQVIPNNDKRLHEKIGTSCWCEPRIEFENGKRIVVHEAKDKRK